MATRRNVPSRDVFRVLKGSLNQAFENSSNLVPSTPLLAGSCLRSTNSYLSTNSLTPTWPPRSAIHRQGSLPSTSPTNRTRQTCPKFGSFVRSISMSKKSSTAVSAELPAYAYDPFHLADLELNHSVPLPFARSPSTNLSIDGLNQRQEKDDTEYNLRTDGEGFIDELLEDDIAPVDENQMAGDAVSVVLPYLAFNQKIPLYVPQKFGYYIKTIRDDGDPRHNYLYNYILLLRDRHGDNPASQAAREILKCYVGTRLDQDWQLAKRLYISLCYRLMPVSLRSIRNLLVRSMLKEFPPRLEAVSLLTEKIESDSRITTRHIHSYLEEFCEQQPDLDLQLAEADKILQSVQDNPDFGTTRILLPLVRYAVEANDPDHAWNLTVRFSRDYNLSPHFSVLSEVIKGYARQENMSAIDELLGELHCRGLSRSKPYEFAALVRTVFHFLVSVRDRGRMFDFLTYAIRNHGLVPTSTLSVSVAKNFVASRRYDLVQKWVKTQQKWFPNVLNLLHTPLAAYEINDAWTNMPASPSDILYTCKALAYGTLRNPFSEEFRHMTNSWLSSSLYNLNKGLMLQIDVDEEHIGLKRFSDVQAAFECSRRLIKSASHGVSDTRKSLLVNAFQKKAEAAQEVEFLVNRFSEYVQQHGPVLDFGEQTFLEQKRSTRQAPTYKMPSKVKNMTGHKLARTILDVYGNDLHGGHDQRDMVIKTVRYLLRAQRHRDCAILVQEFWNSGYVTGAFFTHEILKCWVITAYELRDRKLLHEALWATIDSEPAHTVGYKFLMLIRAAVSVVTEDVRVDRKQQYPNQLHELEYLISRCYRRRWQEDGCPKAEDIADPFLKKWKAEQGKSTRDSLQISFDYVL